LLKTQFSVEIAWPEFGIRRGGSGAVESRALTMRGEGVDPESQWLYIGALRIHRGTSCLWRLHMQLPSYAELFMKYDYAESKDLCKEFLTLVSGVLVFSVTFAEKIIAFSDHRSRGRWTLFGSWISLIVALILGGIGLALLGMAADVAVHAPDLSRILLLENRSVLFMFWGGVFFVLGLILIVLAGALSMFARPVARP
jgi:hypothetical protein